MTSVEIGRVGWVGTGRMGTAMVRRLLDAGVPVTVWNRTRTKTTSLADQGAEVAEAVSDLSGCDVVFVTVSTSDDLRQVILGEDGLLSTAESPSVVVDCSTVSEEVSAEIRVAAEAAGTSFLAAPVSGNPQVVTEGRACLVVSGPRDAFDRIADCLGVLAERAVYVGDQEQSRLVKLCHNLYLGMVVQALVEVTTLAEKGGTDRAAFLEFLGGTVLASEWVRRRSGDLVARNWAPTFTTELLRKDFDLGLHAARALEVPMPVGAAVHQLIQMAIGRGWGQQDLLSLYELQAQVAALPSEGPKS